MINILDSLKTGNFAAIKDSLNNTLQGNSPQGNPPQGNNSSNIMDNIGSSLGGLGGIGGLLGAGALGGLLGTLMSGSTAKKVAKGALVYGGTAAAGALAWNFYKKWAASSNEGQSAAQSPNTFGNQSQEANQQANPQASPQQNTQEQVPLDNDTSIILLEAMVFAARADGHIDASEQQNINNIVTQMFPNQDIKALLDSLINKPIDPNTLAARLKSPEEALDVYRLSCMILEIDHFMERSYLDGLAAALNIPNAQKQELEKEVTDVKMQLAQG